MLDVELTSLIAKHNSCVTCGLFFMSYWFVIFGGSWAKKNGYGHWATQWQVEPHTKLHRDNTLSPHHGPIRHPVCPDSILKYLLPVLREHRKTNAASLSAWYYNGESFQFQTALLQLYRHVVSTCFNTSNAKPRYLPGGDWDQREVMVTLPV